jgi:uncharacterized protein (DUF885 family)
MSSIAPLVDAFLIEWYALDPVGATSVGMHAHDHRWPDLSETGRAARRAFVDRWAEQFRRPAEAELSLDDRVDRELMLAVLDGMRFEEDVLGEDAWSAMAWVYLIGAGLFDLLAREFAPLADRLTSLAGRAEALPRLLDAARARLVGVAGRPVDRLHAESALTQWPGLISIVDDGIEAGEIAAAGGDEAAGRVLPRLRAARETAAAALDGFERHLRDDLLPDADGEGRLGADLYAAKLVHTFHDPSITPDTIRERAEREFRAIRAEMIRIAREIAPRWLGDDAATVPADDDNAIVRAVLDAIAHEHPDRHGMLDACRAELARIEAFCRERDLVGLADEPLLIDWTPVFLRAFGGAMLSSPGPLDKGQKAIFSITPIPDDATPDQVESALREDNDRMIRLLTIHEAVPGHYLQGVYANRCPSMARTIFWSGVYAEGWAVYVTQVMMDVGYGADDPALLLTHWKYYLRSVTNALIDVGIHAAGMTEDEAVSLMIDGGFQEEAQARAKYQRARLSSTQLSTYFLGSLAFWDLEDEARRRAAAGAGDARRAQAVVRRELPGGYGETPGFTYRPHLEACLVHGAPPMPLLRRLVIGD